MDVATCYLKLIFTFLSIDWLQKLMKKEMLTEIFFLKKGQEILEKIVDCKFIRTNTSKKCYDLGDGSGSIPNLLLNQRKH